MVTNSSTSPKQKVALVTGAAQGIGAALAIGLAKEGFTVAVADLGFQKDKAAETMKEIEQANPGSKSIFIPTDVSDRSQVFNAVEKTYETYGSFDVMVNNAGICIIKTLLDTTEADSQKIWNINVNGVLFGIQAAAENFIKTKTEGKIINACSICGYTTMPTMGAYCGTKFAVKALTQTAAKELSKYKIKVNAYCPGIVNTPMWDLIDSKMAEINNVPIGVSKKAYVDGIALGRSEEPEDLVGLVNFLAGSGSDYITGQSIIADGGIVYS